MEKIRLNKALSELGVCSRREADSLIEAGKVLVDGRPAVTGQKVSLSQQITCNGRPVCGPQNTRAPKPVWLVVNKPRGVVCTTSDKDRAPNVVELVDYPDRVYPVGRLDKDSEGLLLMTNQGGLANRLLHSSNLHEREYLVKINRPVTKEFLNAMENGVELKELNRVTRPCRAAAAGPDRFKIVLTQGLNRQIRRMCEALGCRVLELKRIRIMHIRLGNLKTGSFRKMTEPEYRELIARLAPPAAKKDTGTHK